MDSAWCRHVSLLSGSLGWGGLLGSIILLSPGTSAGDQGTEPGRHCLRGWAGSEQPGLSPLTGFLPVEALPGRDISVVFKDSSCPPASVSLVHVGTFSLSGVFK